MAAKPHIPSAEEIKRKLELKKLGLTEDDIKVATKESDKLVQENKELKQKVRSKLLSTKNLRSTICEMIDDSGVHPVAELLEMVSEKDAMGNYVLDAKLRASIHMELLQYITPKLKAVEVKGEIDNNITIKIQRFGDKTPVEVATQVVTQTPVLPEVVDA